MSQIRPLAYGGRAYGATMLASFCRPPVLPTLCSLPTRSYGTSVSKDRQCRIYRGPRVLRNPRQRMETDPRQTATFLSLAL